jgi:16S rRNA processing protein RimM
VFRGIETREGAEALRGLPIEIASDRLPAPADDTYYRFDLVGCTAVQGDRRLGVVAAVEDGVAHDVLLLDTGVRLPFVAVVVPDVDIPGRLLTIAIDIELHDDAPD